MRDADFTKVLATAHRIAERWLDELPTRSVGPQMGPDEMYERVASPLGDDGCDAADVIEELAELIEPGLTATGSGRFFGFVNGGTLPVALGADWLVSAWDQNTPFASAYPGTAAIEQVAGDWICSVLDLPATAEVGFTTGAQMANTIGLAAGRNAVLAAHGVDVEVDGVRGGPPISVVVGEARHTTIDRAVRLLGLGTSSVHPVPVDDGGRMDAEALRRELRSHSGPVIVCAQAGNVSGGAFDPVADVAAAVNEERENGRDDLWLHVDGAFGLWVRASNRFRHLADGVELADSWSTDGHKWLNTPYDCGIAIVAHAEPLVRSMALRAVYLVETTGAVRDPSDRTPESSRRARALVVWAALRALGRRGLADIVDRACDRATEFAHQLGAEPGIIVHHQEINQVVVSLADPAGIDDDAHSRSVMERVQIEGTCYPTGTVWHGRAAMRISVSNWRTDEADVEASVEAILAAHGS